MSEDFETEDLVEQYLLFLRGRGPEPTIPESLRREVETLLSVVDALSETAGELPELHLDPVAIRLGLVAGRQPSDGSDEEPDPVELAIHELEHRFGGYVIADLHPQIAIAHPRLRPAAVCTSLGDTVAVVRASLDDEDEVTDLMAVVFRRHPELSAVVLSSNDAERAIVLTAAESNRAVDPEHGWLAPGTTSEPEPLDIALGRHFERVLPRWDQISRLDVLIDGSSTSDAVFGVVDRAVREHLASKPRLSHKKEALESLRRLDAHDIADVVNDVQHGRLAGAAMLERLADIAAANS